MQYPPGKPSTRRVHYTYLALIALTSPADRVGIPAGESDEHQNDKTNTNNTEANEPLRRVYHNYAMKIDEKPVQFDWLVQTVWYKVTTTMRRFELDDSKVTWTRILFQSACASLREVSL